MPWAVAHISADFNSYLGDMGGLHHKKKTRMSNRSVNTKLVYGSAAGWHSVAYSVAYSVA